MSKPTEKKPFFTPEQKEKIKRDLELYRQGELKDEWEDFDLIDVDNAGPWPEDMRKLEEEAAKDGDGVVILE